MTTAKVRRRSTTTTTSTTDPIALFTDDHSSYSSLLSISIDLQVPGQVSTGSNVMIACYYDLSGKSLHSLKWYHEGHEFYRVEPRSHPEIIVLQEEGIQVDVSQ